MQADHTFTLFLDKRPNGVVQPNGTIGEQNHSDYYVSIPLLKTARVADEYVQVSKDSFRATLSWQEVNPFFIELDFFAPITNLFSGDKSVAERAKLYNIALNR